MVEDGSQSRLMQAETAPQAVIAITFLGFAGLSNPQEETFQVGGRCSVRNRG
jgi:hypothetical protein